ncbi:hypothetical protein [Paenibacillus thermotolerans]|uniref:hypothetical protein n=1 Tax=Paenibacillus thermotolerans TaxID=3027807 RepID=UPI002367F53A|nr:MULTISPECIES: hypothetical protein [unclassified Paenibacillus]
MTRIDGVISKAKLIAYLNQSANDLYDKGAHVPAGIMVILRDGIETGEIDLLPELPSTDVDLKEIEEAFHYLEQVVGIQKKVQKIRPLLTKLAEKEAEIERLTKEREQFVCLLPSEVKSWEMQLNQAVEALEKADKLLNRDLPVWAREEIQKALQSIKGDKSEVYLIQISGPGIEPRFLRKPGSDDLEEYTTRGEAEMVADALRSGSSLGLIVDVVAKE